MPFCPLDQNLLGIRRRIPDRSRSAERRPQLWEPPPPELKELRSLVTRRDALERMKTQEMNRLRDARSSIRAGIERKTDSDPTLKKQLRCWLSVILIILFLFLIGLARQALAATCACVTYNDPPNSSIDCNSYKTSTARDAAKNEAAASTYKYYCTTNWITGGDGILCFDYISGNTYPAGIFAFCPDCPDSNNDGVCDPQTPAPMNALSLPRH